MPRMVTFAYGLLFVMLFAYRAYLHEVMPICMTASSFRIFTPAGAI